MQPSLAFVHGIGDHRQVDEERELWCKELARGVRQAGNLEVAAAIEGGGIPVQFVYYRDLFDPPEQHQGSVYQMDDQEAADLAGLMLSLVDQLPEDPEWEWELAHIRALLTPARGQLQGTGAFAGRVIDAATTLTRLPMLRRTGRWVSGRVMVKDLRQVTRYLGRTEPSTEDGQTLDERIRSRVLKEIGPGPLVVVAHSLGTVITLETLRDFPGAVPLWVTLGSPIGMGSVVLPRLRPTPPRTPECVGRWLNFWDKDDFIAVKRNLEDVAQPNSAGVLPQSARVSNPGMFTHTATKYLAQASVGGPIGEALEQDTSRARR